MPSSKTKSSDSNSSVTSSKVRKIRVSDEQLKLFIRGLAALPSTSMTPQENFELGSLVGLLHIVLSCPDEGIEHGLVL